MLYTLENKTYSIKVASLGAELQSLYSKKTNREYMWQANETWGGHSLLLFPTAGRVAHNRTFIRGREYPMPMHGFIKDAEFTAVSQSESELVLEAAANADTAACFPYAFRFRVIFALDDEKVSEKFEIYNDGEDTMYFGFGAHPGFYCPIVLGEKASDYVLEFDRPQNSVEYIREPHTNLLTHKTRPFVEGTTRTLSDSFFDGGPMVAAGVNTDFIRLKSNKSGHYVEMGIKDFPFMTLWGKGTQMTILCIEPWCGTSDFLDADHVWEKKYGNESLPAGEVFKRELTFKLG